MTEWNESMPKTCCDLCLIRLAQKDSCCVAGSLLLYFDKSLVASSLREVEVCCENLSF